MFYSETEQAMFVLQALLSHDKTTGYTEFLKNFQDDSPLSKVVQQLKPLTDEQLKQFNHHTTLTQARERGVCTCNEQARQILAMAGIPYDARAEKPPFDLYISAGDAKVYVLSN